VSETDDHEPSHDPRSWAASGKRSPGSDSDSPSFDPRTWIQAPAAQPPSPPTTSRPARSPSPPARNGSSEGSGGKTRYLALGSGVAIALLGAVTAWSARPANPKPVATTSRPEPKPVVAPGGKSSTIVVPGVADLASNLLAASFTRADAEAVARRAATALGAQAGEIRVSFDYRTTAEGLQLEQLTATRSDGTGITLTARGDGSLAETRQVAQLSRKLRIVRGELDAQSFYSSAVAAGVSDAIVSDFANAFQFDFDLQREVAPGDIIEAGFEQGYNSSGEEVGAPVLVYASLSTAAKSRALYRFRAPGEAKAEWFDSNGRSTRRALMRTPVEAARISSGFGMRDHPILGYAKMHRGTDFAAPTGTPIYASGDATVVFAGPKGANGNFVKLHHDNGWETLYLHMNRILAGVAPGMRVVQGQQIGEVGTTGRSTGPHLHYEVHIDGQPVNPLSIDTGTGRTLSGKALAAFRSVRNAIDTQRAAAE
jgi:murein DD-endopeptidase MepM/ murein hydrolase activator NlpD